MPHMNMPGSSFFCFAQKPNFNVIAGNDICVVQRCCTAPQFEFLKVVAALGMKIVYDLDDNVWNLPEYNPAYQGLMAQREGFNACIRMVDVVSVSTRELGNAVRKNVRDLINIRTGKVIPVVVAENRIDERMFVAPIKQEEKIVVGWAGSSSHIGDLIMLEDALITCSKDYPDIQIQFRGCEPRADSPLLQLPNYSHKLWTPVAEFGARMPLWGWTIALAPVTDHPFNSSKSCIKMMEAAYCKTPCLASWVAPYVDFCSHDKELQWLLCSVPSQWERKLRDLINDKALRDDLGQRMYNVVQERYSLSRPHEGWAEIFKLARN